MEREIIINDVTNYYTEKLDVFGSTPRGVDWSSTESQEMRFHQLVKLIDPNIPKFSVLDYGCGFGALYPFMKKMFINEFLFLGYDISDKMITKAGELHKAGDLLQWINKINMNHKVDYVVSSGIFNVCLNHQRLDWESYILELLHEFNRLSTRGFAFNMLTSYSDKEFMRDNLYYANPCFFFDYCKKHFSKNIALLHDYSPLYEFTIIVRK